MSEMNFKEYLLSEMHLEDWSDEDKDYVEVIAFRSHLWLGGANVSKSRVQKIYRTIRREHPKVHKPYTPVTDWDTLYEFAKEYIPDALTATWDRNRRVLSMPHDDMMSPITSPLVQKAAKALKAKEVTYEVEMDFTKRQKDSWNYGMERDPDYAERTIRLPRNKLLGRLPNHFFHGTTTKYLPGIMKIGLRPDEVDTNYKRIYHPDKVFLGSRFEDAEHHAIHTANLRGGYAVVIDFSIPDPAKIVPDYDVDRTASRDTYDHDDARKDPPASVDSWRMTHHSGLIGYRGAILPNFIRAVYLCAPYGSWRKAKLDTLRKRVMNDPWDWVYKYGMFD